MNYIVVDFEWNQPYTMQHIVQYPFRLNGEIIQIGAVKLDEEFREVDRFDMLIRPRCYRRLHWNVAKLTHLREEDLRSGETFQKAIKMFREWCGQEFCFITWGYDDEGMLTDNLKFYSMSTSWLPKVYNLQVLFDQQYTQENRQVSLTKALEQLGEEGLEAHDALHDAVNTAAVCRHLNMEEGLAHYDEHVRLTQGIQFSEKPMLTVSCWAEAFEHEEITGFECPECKKRVECEGWITKAPDKRVGLAHCPDCSSYYVQVRFRKKGEKSYNVARKVYILTDELKQRYEENRVKEAKRIAAVIRRQQEQSAAGVESCGAD